ncbi:uncharacterized protein LOC111611229 [Xiphophorus maculatus]|uniref:uncharacterized protein LOC111611229 n=1 Tax=Xiphophorus maculatus TaxID=8083 RepID=UPI000C6EACDA|nr:uncharacterized protein LOC111611229 [Xiphophorus maculatus]
MDKHMNAWRVMTKLYKMSPANESDVCSLPAPSCTMETFEKHSGEYWCENDEGERSRALNISITDGPVILKFTAQPVKEGSDVILHCINKKKEQQTQIGDFYKDGQFFQTNYEEVLTLQNVSKSDEGFYKCNISGVGASAESWLSVVKPGNESDVKTEPVQHQTPVITILLCTLGSLFFLVIGLIFFKKHKALKHETVTDPTRATYAVVNKPRRRNGGETRTDDQVTYASIDIRPTGQEVCTDPFRQYSEEPIYSLVNK